MGELNGACVSMPSDLLTRFAIVGADSAGILLRLGMPGGGSCRNNLTQIGLHLPIRGPIVSILPNGARDVCVPPAGHAPLKLNFKE